MDEQIDVGRTFVRYFPQGIESDSLKGVVTGILGCTGDTFAICTIPHRESRVVPKAACKIIPSEDIKSGLTHFHAQWNECGRIKIGAIIAEEIFDGLLHVEICNGNGDLSGFIPITKVTFCCGCA